MFWLLIFVMLLVIIVLRKKRWFNLSKEMVNFIKINFVVFYSLFARYSFFFITVLSDTFIKKNYCWKLKVARLSKKLLKYVKLWVEHRKAINISSLEIYQTHFYNTCFKSLLKFDIYHLLLVIIVRCRYHCQTFSFKVLTKWRRCHSITLNNSVIVICFLALYRTIIVPYLRK